MRKRSSTHDFTLLLHAWGEGDAHALDRLAPLVYRELHRIARGYMAHERPNHTLQATALVNEAYLRLVDTRHANWQDRAHFLAICARAMRQILVDHARSRTAEKHGGGQRALQFDENLGVPESSHSHLLELDDALKVSPRTVKRDWQLARAWLYRELSGKLRDG